MPLDRLTTEDARILRLEKGAVRGHTCKVIVLDRDGAIALAQLRAHVGARLDAAPRLRRRLAPTPLGIAPPVWVDDPDFDIARHVRAVTTDAPIGRAELHRIVARLFAEPLDRAHPLWRMDLVERLEEGGSAIVWRIHHALADGTETMRLASRVLWRPEPDDAPPPRSSWQAADPPGALGLLADGLTERAKRMARRRVRGPLAEARTLYGSRAAIGGELARTATLSSLAVAAGPARSVAFVEAPLEPLKLAGKTIVPGATVNDVALAVVAGGVRSWLRDGDGARIRVKVPVSLHDPAETGSVANRDSCFFVDLPFAEPDPARRLLAIQHETSDCKSRRDAEALYPLTLHRPVARWAMSPRVFTFSVSNVPGPADDVYVAGARVRELYALAEIAQRHVLRLTAVSLAGKLFFGLCADRDAVPRLDELATGMRAAVDELLALTGSAIPQV